MIRTISVDTPLNKITSASVKKGLGGRIFSYGTVIITSGIVYKFDYISKPDVFKKVMMDEIDKYEEVYIQKQTNILAGTIKNSQSDGEK